MLDTETLKLVETARDRRQIELSARLADADITSKDGRPDPHAAGMRAQVWDDARAAISQAVDKYAHEGLRILRSEKTRPGLILTAPAATWRRFLKEERSLVGSRTIDFRHYIKPWSFGLPGFPE